jgi:hypothetical protein
LLLLLFLKANTFSGLGLKRTPRSANRSWATGALVRTLGNYKRYVVSVHSFATKQQPLAPTRTSNVT